MPKKKLKKPTLRKPRAKPTRVHKAKKKELVEKTLDDILLELANRKGNWDY